MPVYRTPDASVETPVPSGLRPGHVRPALAWQIICAAASLVLFSTLFVETPQIISRPFGLMTSDLFYMQSIFRFNVALCGAFLTAWFLQPGAAAALDGWKARLTGKQRHGLVLATVGLVCAGFALFIVHFGRWQFGGFDYNILLEIGWRQILGQRPYVDFPTTSPPLFNLGALLAFRLFGVSWNGIVYFTALFTVGTLLWIFSLLRRLGMGSLAALGVAATMEAATMLSCCFWWYNNSTLLLAAIFFLSALLLSRSPRSNAGQWSYVLVLPLLALAKPNIGGITIAGSLALLLFISRHRGRMLLLTLAGVALFGLIVLVAHISLPAMLAAYRGAAKERGAFSTFGFEEFSWGEKRFVKLWYLALCLPLLACVRPIAADFRKRQWKVLAGWLFFPLGALVAIYGLRGNGELRDVEAAVLLSALGLLAFVDRADVPRLQRYTVGLLCAMAASNMYTGITRTRVFTVGAHLFFEWTDNQHRIPNGPLKDMRVSGTFMQVNDEVQQAVHTSPGPYFFGPRIDYSYMALGLPSPAHFPAWWHPGTAFDRALMPSILAQWEQHHYPTLIYLKDDYTQYPRQFLSALQTEYTRDDHMPLVTVFHRRPGL